jgi:hypothetical protein
LTPIESALRSARILHVCFLVAAGLYLLVLFQLRPMERSVDSLLVYALGFLSLLVVGTGFFLRGRMVVETAARLSINPQDATSLKQWRSGQIVSFAFAESVVLYGFVLKFLGASWNIAGVFFIAGILLLVAWTPKLEVSGSNS